jgi:hypothetical protein
MKGGASKPKQPDTSSVKFSAAITLENKKKKMIRSAASSHTAPTSKHPSQQKNSMAQILRRTLTYGYDLVGANLRAAGLRHQRERIQTLCHCEAMAVRCGARGFWLRCSGIQTELERVEMS